MRCSGLRGDFARSHAAQRFCAWNRELHVPEVRFGRDELHSDTLLSIASPVDGNNAAFQRLPGAVVHQDQRLPHQHDLFKPFFATKVKQGHFGFDLKSDL